MIQLLVFIVCVCMCVWCRTKVMLLKPSVDMKYRVKLINHFISIMKVRNAYKLQFMIRIHS